MHIFYSRKKGLGLYFLLTGLTLLIFTGTASSKETLFQNVIVLVADGVGSTHTTAARWYKGSPLALDRMQIGAVRTYASNSLITDSAPAASAFATGHKTSDMMISVLPDSTTMPGLKRIHYNFIHKPVATVLEGARLSGRSVGIIATSNIQHATPAAYTAHWPDRNNFNEIAKQQVYQNMDVVLGGGKKYLLPEKTGGARTDGEDLVEVLKSRGYDIVETKDAMQKSTARKIWGMFADDDMAYEFDRRVLRPEEPTLSDMTKKAIEVLSKNPKGFFLFIEGSKIDWASHANDPAGVMGDVIAFDDALKAALGFAQKDGKTMVLAFSDHGCGGMFFGNLINNIKSFQLPYEAVFAPLKKVKLTCTGMEKIIADNISDEYIKNIMSQYAGIDDLTKEEVNAIKSSKRGTMCSAIAPIINRRANILWATGWHTGEDLFFYAYGLAGNIGLIENTEIAHIAAKGMGFALDSIDRELFIDAEEAFKKIGARTRIDRKDPANPMLVAESNGRYAELPFSKDIIRTGKRRKEQRIPGMTIFSPWTHKVYIPEQAVSIFSVQIN